MLSDIRSFGSEVSGRRAPVTSAPFPTALCDLETRSSGQMLEAGRVQQHRDGSLEERLPRSLQAWAVDRAGESRETGKTRAPVSCYLSTIRGEEQDVAAHHLRSQGAVLWEGKGLEQRDFRSFTCNGEATTRSLLSNVKALSRKGLHASEERMVVPGLPLLPLWLPSDLREVRRTSLFALPSTSVKGRTRVCGRGCVAGCSFLYFFFCFSPDRLSA